MTIDELAAALERASKVRPIYPPGRMTWRQWARLILRGRP